MLLRVLTCRFWASAFLAALVSTSGCNSILNGWLSPIELGSFTRESTLDIRSSLSIQDTPGVQRGVTDPLAADLVASVEEYRAECGDALNVFINELRDRGVETAQQATINSRGMINLPVVGWVKAAGLTARELEQKLRRILADRDILYDAEVLVQFAAKQGMTYTLFGNEDLAIRLNRGPGVFPIPRPDFRLIDALAVAGGLSELMSEIYIFRKVSRDKAQAAAVEELRREGPPAGLSGEERGVGPDTEELPGALPSVITSTGLDRAGAASFIGGTEWQAEEGGGSQVGQPAGQEPPPEETPSQGKEEEPKSEAQEIIDLMLGKTSSGDAGVGEQAQLGAGAADPEGVPQHEPDQGLDPRPERRFIYDESSHQWIEVRPDLGGAEAVAPIIPPDEEALEPVVDWVAIAEEEHDVRVIRVSTAGLRQGDPRQNLVVRAGDIIRVYSGDIGFYYILGHVNRPGVFAFRSGASVTLKNAVAAAGGLDALAWPDRVTVYRRVGQREQMIQVNLDRIFAGLDADFFLKRDDIVNVGTHPVAPFLLQIRNMTIPQLNSSMSFLYRWSRTETFFKNENLATTATRGLFP